MGVETKRTKHRIEKSKDRNEHHGRWMGMGTSKPCRRQISDQISVLELLTGVKEAKGIFYSGFYIDQPRENCALAYYESSISIHEIQHYSWPK